MLSNRYAYSSHLDIQFLLTRCFCLCRNQESKVKVENSNELVVGDGREASRFKVFIFLWFLFGFSKIFEAGLRSWPL